MRWILVNLKNLNYIFPNAAKFDRPLIEVNIELLVQRLNPFWITGFIAAEGSFHITFPKKAKQIRARFSIGLNQRDKFILLKINNFFPVIGSVYVTPSNNSAELKIFKSSNFYILINHFKVYYLQGFKLYNYTVWRDLV